MIRYAFRSLRASPGFAAVSILSLALGIGANTAIFSLIDAVVLRSLPVSHPEELFQLPSTTNPIWEAIRDRQDVFSVILGYCRWHFNLAQGGEVRNVDGAYVSGQYFDLLGAHAMLGRTLKPADDKRGCPGTAVLTHGFWQREYGGRRDVIGKIISLDNHPFEILGVIEPWFTGMDVGASLDVMVPLCSEKIIHSHGEASLLDNQLAFWIRIVGRLKPGISASQATARMETLAPAIYEASTPKNYRPQEHNGLELERPFVLQPAANGLSFLRELYRQPLIILMAIVGVVLLIACANVANLLMARGAARQREIAIRMALGSGRGRLIRQFLTESLLLSTMGAALGILFAMWGTRLLVRFLDVFLDLTIDLRVLAFTAGVTILTALLFGIAPAWRGTRVDPQAAMKANGRGVIEGSRFGLGKVLVTFQVALSLLLVVGAGLMLSTFWKLARMDAGFDRDHVLMVSTDFRNVNYPREHRLAVFQGILAKLRTIPGVRSASASNIPPIGMARWKNVLEIEGYTAKSRADATVLFAQVSNQYFETLGTGMLAGRDFNSHDTPTSPPVAIINETMAKTYFGATSPVGKHYRVREGDRLNEPVEIIGVVRDSKYGALREDIRPVAYISWDRDGMPDTHTNFELRTAGASPRALIAGVKSAMAEVNPGLVFEFTTLGGEIDKSLEREQLLAALSGFFGALALLLAMIGLYGVMSYNVARRRNEIGIRMALGAEQSRVLRMVLREVALLIGIGLAIGLGLALATTRFVASFLYGMKPNDPWTLALAAAVLAAVAAFAGYLPARRASRLDPMTALREE